MQEKRVYTLKNQMAGFSVAVMGAVILLNVYTLLFCGNYNGQYKRIIDYSSRLNLYFIDAENTKSELKLYTEFDEGEAENYNLAQEKMEAAKQRLEEIQSSVMDIDFQRKMQSLIEMTDCAIEQIKEISRDIREGIEFAQINEKYKKLCAVYEAIHEENEWVNRSFFSYVDHYSKEMERRGVWFAACFVGILGLLCYFILGELRRMYQAIVIPVQELVKGALQVGEGVFKEVAISAKKIRINYDIAVLVKTFNKMTGQLREQVELMKENMRFQKELQEQRFRELQLQINPHFMFNTLNLISETAYFEKAPKSVALINKTAKMFRFILDFTGTPVTLYHEIEELGNYIEIQELQYEGRVDFAFELQECFHDIKIPSLTLQPLVENALSHGVRRLVKGGRIRLITKYEKAEQAGYIVVEDNGVGMSKERLKQVVEKMEKYDINLSDSSASGKIGLGNVYSRLKLFYGEKCSMQLESREGEGTRVIIRITGLCREEGTYVQTADCR